jgi:hypothetical protein
LPARAKAAQALAREGTSGIDGEEFKKFRRLGMSVILTVWGVVLIAIVFWVARLMQN